jgi:hypothetical protein
MNKDAKTVYIIELVVILDKPADTTFRHQTDSDGQLTIWPKTEGVNIIGATIVEKGK